MRRREGLPRAGRRIEPKGNEQMNQDGRTVVSALCWGLTRVTVQVHLNVIAVNAIRSVERLAHAAALQELVPASVEGHRERIVEWFARRFRPA